MPNQRYKITLAYRGTHYHGWQRQIALPSWRGPQPKQGLGIPTIQETVARALGQFVGHPVSLVGSSRTDSGVHAKGQIAHFDTDQLQIPPEGMRLAVNYRLPDDILIREIVPVPDSFDAILSTASKRYQYFIWAARDRNPLFGELCWHRWQELDFDAMKSAAEHYIGRHDFTSFAKPGHQRESNVRQINDFSVSRRGKMIVMGVNGNGFLWNMVRIMVGTLVEIGLKRYEPDDIPRMLAACDRRAGGSTAPPQGLILQWIKMKDE